METRIIIIVGVYYPALSENQCGMETPKQKRPVYVFVKVEREPMWDGNGLGRLKTTKPALVEREPMWDGNYSPGRIGAVPVELSENQCGMETFYRWK